ncbi:MAG: Uma2 family endonuclease [Saprospiraceae bacterium]|nr:Uma2 family endonuclease [Saprospiraceae bacterium]
MVKTLELAKKLVTAEEYLKMDRIAIREKIGKYELFNQKLIFMPRGTPQHGELIMNVGTLLNMQKMQHRTKQRVITDTKVVCLTGYKNYFYPDVFVVEEDVIFDDEKKDVVTNPVLIVEILSPESTEGFDRGDKFNEYRQIPTFREYVLVSQNKKQIDQFYKISDDEWVLKSFEKGVVQLKSMPFELDIDGVYDNIELLPYPYFDKDESKK